MDIVLQIALGSITTAIAVVRSKIKPNPKTDPAIDKANKKTNRILKGLKTASAAITESLLPDEEVSEA